MIRSRLRGDGFNTTSPYVLRRMGASGLYDHTKISSVARRRVVAPVYTLSVNAPEHSYVANGFLAKNSGASAIIHDATFEVIEEFPHFYAGIGTGLVQQGHDALVLEVPEKDAQRALKTLERCMTRRYEGLDVDFLPEVNITRNWAKAA